MSKTLFLIIGYILFTVYTVGIMLLGALLEKKTSLDKTICRKLTHIISAGVWVICYIFFGCSIHWVLLNGIGTILLGFIVFGNRMSFIERDDAEKSYGLFFFGLSTFIVALICYLVGEELYFCAGLAYYCLAIGDGLAPVAAILAKDHNRKIREGKSVVGTLTVFLATLLAAVVFNLVLKVGYDFYFLLSVAALTCVVEFYGSRGADNLYIEFSVFAYLVLHHYGLISPVLQTVVLASPLLAVLAIGSGSMTEGAGIAALLVFLAVGFFSDSFVPVLFIALLFALTTVVHFITTKRFFRDREESHRKQPRKWHQIAAVGLWPCIALAVWYFTHKPVFLLLFFLSLTEQFADSMASDIGRLTRHKNISIVTFKPIEKGLSGGVSVLGTGMALLSALLLMLVPLALKVISLPEYLGISLLAFIGMAIDSLLGGLLQVLYRCPDCGLLTETRQCCGTEAVRIKGISFIGNAEVNAITGLITCGLGFLLLLL